MDKQKKQTRPPNGVPPMAHSSRCEIAEDFYVQNAFYWMYSPGKNADKWDEFFESGIMAIGWDELGDLRAYPDKGAIRAKMCQSYGGDFSYRNWVLAAWQFSRELHVGDVVFVKRGRGKLIGRGIVTGEYTFDPSRTEYRNILSVHWTHRGEWDMPSPAPSKVLTNVSDYIDYVTAIEGLLTDEDAWSELPEKKQIACPAYDKTCFLQDCYLTEDDYDTLMALLRRKRNLILQGPPGVGKTFTARRLAWALMGEKDLSRIESVQFHESYGYEDFILGYRPDGDGFSLTQGRFYRFCKRAEEDDEHKYVFLIDEINRGNLGKIFGELLVLLEGDKRGEKLPLLYGNELFSVPANVYIIGMMNTADRALALMDYALRRRFAFFTLAPAFGSPAFAARLGAGNNPKLLRLARAVQQLNAAIAEDETLGKGFCLGHSFLCYDGLVPDDMLAETVRCELLPLLEEYWYDDPAKVEQWKSVLLGALR